MTRGRTEHHHRQEADENDQISAGGPSHRMAREKSGSCPQLEGIASGFTKVDERASQDLEVIEPWFNPGNTGQVVREH